MPPIALPLRLSVGFRGDHRLDLMGLEPRQKFVGVVPLIGQTSMSRESLHQRYRLTYIGRLPTAQDEFEGETQAVNRRMNLATKAPS